MSDFSIAVDMHGGDYGFSAMGEAVYASLPYLPETLSVVLCGEESSLAPFIQRNRLEPLVDSGRIRLVYAHNVPVGASASAFYKKHSDSSLVRSVALQKEGAVTLSLSAGDTGALYGAALFLLGRQSGIERPALAATVPSARGSVVLLLDVGANLTCRSQHLIDFAHLGSTFMERVITAPPVVSLLNVGMESHKGTREVRQAHEALSKSSRLVYDGYIEGNRVLTGDADVIVCNGFVGNAVLKLSEGIFRFVRREFQDGLNDRGRKKLHCFDAELYGAVPLLGVRGHVYKAHGSSSVTALTNALVTAAKTLYL
ncbi:fatty acid/phospholipid synthesis protein PlsX [Chitinivibrio alkaliphilus]|uniref:Phosphate acyltransferase n=1 Tax=Chitinivibrio alkaliphilus ACht1 TaxID=1313304 RepID=U7D8I0_9BACT|nr:fatty acid/phospholipid synthesis protein PlsX [Chitinivibrio alkaliphilus]ERP38704.1 fatty acid/phospholipid synthesis protein PlsX [Chitinivibrio alkaliphilus ACht1]